MATNMEILYGLREILGVAIIRASNQGLLYMNSEALEMFRFRSLEEASTCQRRALFADCNSYHHFLIKQEAYGTLVNERVLFCRGDKSNFWGSITSRLYYVNGDIRYDEIIVDITDKVAIEHKLCEKSHLLEKVANELDRFIYSASHDLRSPICSMRGLVSLFKTDAEAFPPDQFLSMIEESLNKLETFVTRLVEFSKNANEPVLIEPVDIGKIVHAVLDELKGHMNKDKVNIECSLDDTSWVYSDFNKLYSILFQIIKNSFDYVDSTKPRTVLSIKSEVLQDQVLIEIVDNGIGIDKKSLPTVFQMFYRATQLSKGSGLGLFLAREAITRLGGTIEIKSEINRGTFISLRIPNDGNARCKQLQMA